MIHFRVVGNKSEFMIYNIYLLLATKGQDGLNQGINRKKKL